MKFISLLRFFGIAAVFAALNPLKAVADNGLSGISGAFAPVDLGAKSSALAGAQTADPYPSEVLLFNPGALYDAGWSGGYSFSRSFEVLDYNFISGSWRMSGLPLAFGMAAIQNGDEIYSENEVYLSAAGAWKNWRGGLSWKLRYSSTGSGGEDFIDPEKSKNTKVSGSGLGLSGFDFGIKAIFFDGRLMLGGVLKDAFSAIAWSTENEAGTAEGDYFEFVPVSVKIGGQVKIVEDMILSIDYEPGPHYLPPPFDWWLLKDYADIKNRLVSGLEILPLYRFTDYEPVRRLLAIRGGYSETIFEADKSKVFGMGGGIAFPLGFAGARASIDGGYQINTFFEGHNSFRIGMSIFSR